MPSFPSHTDVSSLPNINYTRNNASHNDPSMATKPVPVAVPTWRELVVAYVAEGMYDAYLSWEMVIYKSKRDTDKMVSPSKSSTTPPPISSTISFFFQQQSAIISRLPHSLDPTRIIAYSKFQECNIGSMAPPPETARTAIQITTVLA